jgi:hypothetical protein
LQLTIFRLVTILPLEKFWRKEDAMADKRKVRKRFSTREEAWLQL